MKTLTSLVIVAMILGTASTASAGERSHRHRPVFVRSAPVVRVVRPPVVVHRRPVYRPMPVYYAPPPMVRVVRPVPVVYHHRPTTLEGVAGIVGVALGGAADIVAVSRQSSPTMIAPMPLPAPPPPYQVEAPPAGFVETGRRYHKHGGDTGRLDYIKGWLNGREVKVEYNDFGQIEEIDD